MKRVAVLGSTGSIGRAALEVIRHLGPSYKVCALAAKTHWRLLAAQACDFRPKWVVLGDQRHAEALRHRLTDCKVALLVGSEGMETVAASPDVDIVLLAVSGAVGLPAALAALKSGKTLAIANKEPLVMAGDILMRTARRCGATILPVDSEHSGVMQALRSGKRREVRRVILTASGGPFLNVPANRVKNATKEQALSHPTWKMGNKISIDSATMMNKALEIIEAKWFFDLSPDQIEVVIHPQSVLHALVEFCDGSIVAQMALPDMKLPIQFALTYPERLDGLARSIRLDHLGSLAFFAPDVKKFPALELGYRAAREGGTMGAVLNAANEVAVAAFLAGRLNFGGIVQTVARVMDAHRVVPRPSLRAILSADAWARQQANAIIG